MYQRLLLELPGKLSKDEIILALSFFKIKDYIYRQKRYYQNFLQEIIKRSIKLINDRNIYINLIKFIYSRFEYSDFEYFLNDPETKNVLINDTKLRRQIVKDLLQKMKKDDEISNLILHHQAFVQESDIEWVTVNIKDENNLADKERWIQLLKIMFEYFGISNFSIFYKIKDIHPLIKSMIENSIKPIDIDSEQANTLKEKYNRFSRSYQLPEEQQDTLDLLISLKNEIEKYRETKDYELLYNIYNLFNKINRDSIHSSDIFAVPKSKYWGDLTSREQQNIIDCAKQYINKHNPNNLRLLLRKSIPYHDFLGLVAMIIILKFDIENLINIDHLTLKKWIPILLRSSAFFNKEQIKDQEKLLEIVCKDNSQTLNKTLILIIKQANNKNESVFLDNIINKLWNNELEKLLFKLIDTESLNANTLTCILDILLQKNSKNTESFLDTKIRNSPKGKISKDGNIIIYISSLINNSKYNKWALIWKTINSNELVASHVLERSADSLLNKSTILNDMNETEIANLYLLLKKKYPKEQYRTSGEAYITNTRDDIDDLKRRLIYKLENFDTKKAIKVLSKIIKQAPNSKWLYLSREKVIRNFLLKKWKPKPSAFINKILTEPIKSKLSGKWKWWGSIFLALVFGLLTAISHKKLGLDIAIFVIMVYLSWGVWDVKIKLKTKIILQVLLMIIGAISIMYLNSYLISLFFNTNT